MSQNLERSLAYFDRHRASDAEDVLERWRARTGAKLQFKNGTFELTYCGVRGSATSGAAAQLIRSWTRNARRKLDVLNAVKP
ncbi:MAG: hypothetical protein NXH91_11985 [Phyllobacteriaceae bacterium]|nr:hypothetical protein [Phyllobacteriaceae bacterium]